MKCLYNVMEMHCHSCRSTGFRYADLNKECFHNIALNGELVNTVCFLMHLIMYFE